ncbi:MAG: hypothetical protein JJ974_04190 [Phycisphaerales bacterium]|nr:hypothetical protein [Phycisphaerales bacterium]
MPSPSNSKLQQAAVESAEQWVIECPKCYHAAPALERGIFRAWASSKSKRILARCTNCNKLTLAKLTKDPVRAYSLRIDEYDHMLDQLDELDQSESSAPSIN